MAYLLAGSLLIYHLGPTALEWSIWGATNAVAGVYWLAWGRGAARRRLSAEEAARRTRLLDDLRAIVHDEEGRALLQSLVDQAAVTNDDGNGDTPLMLKG